MIKNIIFSIGCIFTLAFVSLNTHATAAEDIDRCIKECDKYYEAHKSSTEGFTFFSHFMNKPWGGFSKEYCDEAREHGMKICYNPEGGFLETCKAIAYTAAHALNKSCTLACLIDVQEQCKQK